MVIMHGGVFIVGADRCSITKYGFTRSCIIDCGVSL